MINWNKMQTRLEWENNKRRRGKRVEKALSTK